MRPWALREFLRRASTPSDRDFAPAPNAQIPRYFPSEIAQCHTRANRTAPEFLYLFRMRSRMRAHARGAFRWLRFFPRSSFTDEALALHRARWRKRTTALLRCRAAA